MHKKIIHPINFLALVGIVDIIIIVLTEPIFSSLNNRAFGAYEESYLQPFFYGSLIFAFCIAIFLFSPVSHFKNWLKYIASWYVPVSVFFISQINIYSSSVMSIDRTMAAVYWMLGLFVLTTIFVVGHLLYDWKNKR